MFFDRFAIGIDRYFLKDGRTSVSFSTAKQRLSTQLTSFALDLPAFRLPACFQIVIERHFITRQLQIKRVYVHVCLTLDLHVQATSFHITTLTNNLQL